MTFRADKSSGVGREIGAKRKRPAPDKRRAFVHCEYAYFGISTSVTGVRGAVPVSITRVTAR